MVLPFTIACLWGVNIHEPIRRLNIADTDREPHTRGNGPENLTAGR